MTQKRKSERIPPLIVRPQEPRDSGVGSRTEDREAFRQLSTAAADRLGILAGSFSSQAQGEPDLPLATATHDRDGLELMGNSSSPQLSTEGTAVAPLASVVGQLSLFAQNMEFLREQQRRVFDVLGDLLGHRTEVSVLNNMLGVIGNHLSTELSWMSLIFEGTWMFVPAKKRVISGAQAAIKELQEQQKKYLRRLKSTVFGVWDSLEDAIDSLAAASGQEPPTPHRKPAMPKGAADVDKSKLGLPKAKELDAQKFLENDCKVLRKLISVLNTKRAALSSSPLPALSDLVNPLIQALEKEEKALSGPSSAGGEYLSQTKRAILQGLVARLREAMENGTFARLTAMTEAFAIPTVVAQIEGWISELRDLGCEPPPK